MTRINLGDLSLIIPFRYDHMDRIDNLRVVLDYYDRYFEGYEFLIYENGLEQYGQEFANHSNVVYQFQKNDGLLHRTKMLNDGAKASIRKYISLYDTDVLFHPESIKATMETLRAGYNFVFPYNGIFIDVSGNQKKEIMHKLKINIPIMDKTELYKKWGDKMHVVHTHSMGGATFFNREVFLRAGGYNQNFISWGFEDNEIVHRFTILGCPPVRIRKSNLYHLNHFRGTDSQPNLPHVKKNELELAKVKAMSKDQLINYVKKDLLVKLGT